MKDSQVTEILGRNRLIDELLCAGLEVSLPLRDRGIDLIAYSQGVPGIQRGLASTRGHLQVVVFGGS